MTGIDENDNDGLGDVESSAGGVIGIVAELTETESPEAEFERIAVLQDELHEPENWCPEKAGELHGLLGKRVDHLRRELEEHPLRMDGSGRESRGELGQHIAYDLGLLERQKAMLALALQHGREHPETERARQAVRQHVEHWMSRRGR